MNKFVKSNSFLSIFLTLFCAVTLLNDGANLTDFYSNITTVHFDEVDGATTAPQAVSTLCSTPSYSSFFSLNRKDCVSAAKTVSSTRVILDQDSPSLPAISITSSQTSCIEVEEAAIVHQPVVLAESLYLQNCSLLL